MEAVRDVLVPALWTRSESTRLLQVVPMAGAGSRVRPPSWLRGPSRVEAVVHSGAGPSSGLRDPSRVEAVAQAVAQGGAGPRAAPQHAAGMAGMPASQITELETKSFARSPESL